MKRLMFDHFRRWWRVLVLVALAEFGLGALIALGPEYTYEFWAFALSMWAGPFLISFNLRQGLLRPVAVLPLSGRQMGQAWWIASVPVPAIVLGALLFAGAGTYCHFRPSHSFPVERLAMGSLFTLVWLGMQFAVIFNAAQGLGRNWREYIGTSIISLATVLAFFGSMLLCHDASASSFKSTFLLGVGGLLTVLGWVRAERFDPGRAGLYLGRCEPPNLQRGEARLRQQNRTMPSGECRVPSGYGGVRFLLSTRPLRGFLQIAVMAALMALIFWWQGQMSAQPAKLELVATMIIFMPCWAIVFFQFMPFLRHLGFLRTLPISAARLAAVLLALVLLPVVALGALVAAIAWLGWGGSAALLLLNGYIFALGGAALCAFFSVWRGAGTQGHALLLLSLVGFVLAHLWLQGRYHYLECPITLAGPIAAGCVLLAFVLMLLTLVRSTHVYRAEANPCGGFPMQTER